MAVRRELPLDEISRAVLERAEVVAYLNGSHGQTGAEAEQRVHTYLEELRTTQRYAIYRALKHPLYPILRKITRIGEGTDKVKAATGLGRVVYVSNHRSHTDYLIEPLVLDEEGIRPPVIAAGINLFGGPLGLVHKHVTGAIPIRRNTKDPAYLITLKAYVAEILRKHDLMFYIEGGRSYSGELKAPKTGLVHAALQAGQTDLVFVPCAISYDLVLEDHILSRQKVKRQQRPFSLELAEMVRYAVGYKSRAFVSFGEPIPVGGCDPHSRREMLDLAQLVRTRIGRLMKVVPTTVVAACMRPSIARRELVSRVKAMIELLQTVGANLDETGADATVETAVRLFEARGVLVDESGTLRIRERNVLRYYAHTIDHLLPSATGKAH